MGTKLANSKGSNLYQFWGNVITDKLNAAIVDQGDNVLINLASMNTLRQLNQNYSMLKW